MEDCCREADTYSKMKATSQVKHSVPPARRERAHDLFRERRPVLETMFAPKSVAVIGATERPGSIGSTLMDMLIAGKFGGVIYPINPKHKSVHGIRAFSKISCVPGDVDLAVIVTPAATVPAIVGECADAGV